MSAPYSNQNEAGSMIERGQMMSDPNAQLISTIARLESTVERLNETLVRKDVYDAQRQTDQGAVNEVREDVREIKGTLQWLSRALVTSLALPLISTIVVVYVVKGA